MRKTLTALLLAASLPTLAMAATQESHVHKPMHGEHHSRSAGMFKDLNLTAEQREKVGKLMREHRNDPREITQKYLNKLPQSDRDAMKKELESARQEHDKALRAILTPEQQKTLDARKAQMEKRRAERAEFEAWKAEKAKQAK